jgi:hypothetical protein
MTTGSDFSPPAAVTTVRMDFSVSFYVFLSLFMCPFLWRVHAPDFPADFPWLGWVNP